MRIPEAQMAYKLEQLPDELWARLRLKDPTLAFVRSRDTDGEPILKLVEIVESQDGQPISCTEGSIPWILQPVRARDLNVWIPIPSSDDTAPWRPYPWIRPDDVEWVP